MDAQLVAEGLVRLYRACGRAAQGNVIKPGESLVEARARIDREYGFINVPVGVLAQDLVAILDAMIAIGPVEPSNEPVAVAPHLERLLGGRRQYGPAARQMVSP